MRISDLLIPVLFISVAACSSSQDPELTTDQELTTESADPAPEVSLALGTGEGENFIEGAISVSSQTISAGGQTAIALNIVNTADNNTLYAQTTSVSFTSSCIEQGLATVSSPAESDNGTIDTAYVADGCVGDDLLIASLNSQEASGIITVASAEAGSLQAEFIEHSILAIKGFGTGDLPQSTSIGFVITDVQGLPVKNQSVMFELTNSAGGESLISHQATSDSNGQIQTTLLAGRINNTVRVQAWLADNPEIRAESDTISVSIGPPDQDSFSISADNRVPGAPTFDVIQVNVMVIASDTYNNPVRDGTIINFRAEEGQIESSCETSGGQCSVTWTSANSQPPSLSADNRITILAYTEGEETILNDPNVNGLFDPGESFESLGEVFLDVNNDGQYDELSGIHGFDSFIDFNDNGVYDGPDSDFYKGVRCSNEALMAGHCAEAVQVREFLTLCIVDDEIGGSTGIIDNADGTYTVIVQDTFGNSLPMGSQITLSGTNVELTGATTSYTVPTGLAFSRPVNGEGNYCSDGYTDTFGAELIEPATDGIINLNISPASGTPLSITIKIPATETEQET